jgi:hypothetical protein
MNRNLATPLTSDAKLQRSGRTYMKNFRGHWREVSVMKRPENRKEQNLRVKGGSETRGMGEVGNQVQVDYFIVAFF